MPSHILIADDDPLACSILSTILSSRGHSVVLAENGLAALELLTNQYFDIAILDYHMPLLDGMSTAKRVYDLVASGSRPRFIGVTADPQGLEERHHALAVFDTIVQKPINIPAFIAVIETSLRHLRASVTSRNILSLWRMRGFERRPRAFVASGNRHEASKALEAIFDTTRPENPDIVLLTPGTTLQAVEALRTEGSLFTVPMIDVTGGWGRIADAVFDADDLATWDGVATCAIAFTDRRLRLTNRFFGASGLTDQLLAYVYVSGRDLRPILDPGTDIGITYPGMFPSHAVLFAAQRLVQRGLLRPVPQRHSGGEPAALLRAVRFALTDQAVEMLTGALTTDAFPRASFV